jgi:hypothetical protein
MLNKENQIHNLYCVNFCDSILLRFRFLLGFIIKLQFRYRYGKKLRFLRFRFRNTFNKLILNNITLGESFVAS